MNYKSRTSSAVGTPPRHIHRYCTLALKARKSWLGRVTRVRIHTRAEIHLRNRVDHATCGIQSPKPGASLPPLAPDPYRRPIRRPSVAFCSWPTPGARRASVSGSGSPPGASSEKTHQPPSETILSNLATSGVTWGAATVFGVAPSDHTAPGTARTSISDDEFREMTL